MEQDALFFKEAGMTHLNQPIFVPSGVVGSDAAIIYGNVFRCFGKRDGVTLIDGRQALVSQRYPGYDPLYEWSFVTWFDL